MQAASQIPVSQPQVPVEEVRTEERYYKALDQALKDVSVPMFVYHTVIYAFSGGQAFLPTAGIGLYYFKDTALYNDFYKERVVTAIANGAQEVAKAAKVTAKAALIGVKNASIAVAFGAAFLEVTYFPGDLHNL